MCDKGVDAVSDIIGVCKAASDVQNLVARTTNRELKKRELTIVDHSHTAVSMLLSSLPYNNKCSKSYYFDCKFMKSVVDERSLVVILFKRCL